MIYGYIVAALVLFGAGFGSAWNWQENKYEAQIASMKDEVRQKEAAHAKEVVAKVNVARAEEQAISKTYQDALNEARARESALRRDAAAARIESDGLRDQAAAAARRFAGAAPAAVAEYAATVGELLADCSRSYQAMAATADGHATDVRALSGAWPVKKE